ncbi:hypothetical protein JCM12856_30800 [Spirochaeta dissipatitropha]
MDLTIDGSGRLQLEINLDRVFMEYYRDLSGGETEEIFDLAEIEDVLTGYQGIELLELRSDSPGHLFADMRLQDVEQLMRDERMDVPEIIFFDRAGARSTMHIRFGREDIPRFLRLSPIGETPIVEYLLPPGDGLTRADYIEYLSWALEEYEGSTPIARVIERAEIMIRLVPDGTIISQRGGSVDGSAVVFRVPVIDLVLARRPYEFSLQFEQ